MYVDQLWILCYKIIMYMLYQIAYDPLCQSSGNSNAILLTWGAIVQFSLDSSTLLLFWCKYN